MCQNSVILIPINGEKDLIKLYSHFRENFNGGNDPGHSIGYTWIEERDIYVVHLIGIKVAEGKVYIDQGEKDFSELEKAAAEAGLRVEIWPHSTGPLIYYGKNQR